MSETTAQRRTALITGASSGFGVGVREAVRAPTGSTSCSWRGAGAVMEELAAEVEERHGVTTVVLPKDLSEPHSAADVMANLGERGVRVDALVNNAGFSTYGPLVDTDLDDDDGHAPREHAHAHGAHAALPSRAWSSEDGDES